MPLVRHHTTPKPLSGGASASGTKRRFEVFETKGSGANNSNAVHHHHGHHHSATRQVHPALRGAHIRPWSTGWTASHVGFGAYRAHNHVHYHAM